MAANGEDYEHWPDNAKLQAVSAVPATGYNNRNGLHEHAYQPTGGVTEEPAPKKAPVPQQQRYPQYMPSMGHRARMYYGYEDPRTLPTDSDYAVPVSRAAKEETAPKSQVQPLRKWQGRTKAEVEEDDMKVAAAEGAYAKRSVRPVGMRNDQVVWVVELDGRHSLRTAPEVDVLTGEWKTDPRYKGSWYFVREETEE